MVFGLSGLTCIREGMIELPGLQALCAKRDRRCTHLAQPDFLGSLYACFANHRSSVHGRLSL